ncbi:uncharacterized protein BO96DRAFT_77716 [Aspergillus niger CBS 101883]|uniref:uncharacterized protein n=1 Tax=Aspergillus lacticoffeatus (strain CBS 101883) TaxID=1450533 RepID=UPI000D7EF888|nr:uncharacterized protein BO96DRAFT_77716 [Aspergillus niger CBS 101883]PYH55043.1 hypothetical protein BO96DRAFT_77716 [Aspergillus niger CBS 101883]
MLAQGKSAGLITRRSLDRNQDMLSLLFFSFSQPHLISFDLFPPRRFLAQAALRYWLAGSHSCYN